ncbi:MAG: DUF362 domain-containing protein [Desulfuromonadales bacterium]|nr:DUF362 domain-containing protein [Desulfuromonadales bacterium]
MKTRVVLQRLDNYERHATKAAIAELLAPLGGISAFVRPGQRVLLKPNMLAGKGVEAAVTTHPEIVRAVIELVQSAGGIVSVGDSPGVGTPQQVAQRCGILAVIEETGATFAPFSESIRITPRSGTFHHFEIARDIVEAEVIINLPKLKTHQMMGMTCAVKNLFGAVIGLRKAHGHLQAGADDSGRGAGDGGGWPRQWRPDPAWCPSRRGGTDGGRCCGCGTDRSGAGDDLDLVRG